MKYYEGDITELGRNEVFQFGSNKGGWHGAGSAGFASFGEPGNNWRKYNYGDKPNGWLGFWNVKGVAEGFQIGSMGSSYAIPTVTKPGAKRSISPENISNSIKSFYSFAKSNPNWKFFVAQSAKPGYNGYSPTEMAGMYLVEDPPENVYFQKEFYEILTIIKTNGNP